jgi:general secretion pathway protein J
MNRRGVTLLELLIAVSLLGLLSTGILMALRVGLSAMGKTNTKLVANRRAASVQRILRSQIENYMPSQAWCGEQRIPYFFQGATESMRLVSTYSLEEASRGYPRLLEFQVIPGEQARGVRLIVNEFVYAGPQSTAAVCLGMAPDPASGMVVPTFRPIEPGERSFVLADKLAYCRFLFLLRRPNQPDQWLPAWSFADWPAAVRVEMAPLDPDPTQVPLFNVTAPIRPVRSGV